ncbi:MAG: glycosyltransferase [Bacteroidetes bacterium]|nr:glycosyltransferase [Bacteroidota bacterium]
MEVYVVDNASVDGSVAMLQKKFPEIKLILNRQNVGFSKANNQAIHASKGEYVLLLNPDTVVQEDTFEKCIAFMDSHLNAGGLGVRMIDGKGNFLPESKRAMPTPAVAFYKTFGLARLFPRSKKFGQYHLSYLSETETNKVDILPGAFMLMRRETLDKVGLLDEDFFMYGEDIDLSYRIKQGGYHNYYFPETTIIHYKGESTKKTSVNYVFVFYQAMLIFARKHFSKRKLQIFSLFINVAIYFRAFIALLRRFILRFLTPVLDLILLYTGMYLITYGWGSLHFNDPDRYPDTLYYLIFPIYIAIWMISIYLMGGYDKPVRYLKIVKGILYGTLVILAVYALLPIHLRFSRAIIVISTAWAFTAMFVTRIILSKISLHHFKFEIRKSKKRFLFVGKIDEVNKAIDIIKQNFIKPELLAIVSDINKPAEDERIIGSYDQIQDVVKINKIDEIIFCARDLSSMFIIKTMLTLGNFNLEFKIASPNGISVIGSSSIDTAGDLYTLDFNSLTNVVNRRKKRMLDIIVAILLLILSPVFIMIIRKTRNLYANIFKLLWGEVTLVGYYGDEGQIAALPAIQKGILSPADGLKNIPETGEDIEKMNLSYARDYKIENDLILLIKNMNKFTRKLQ